jgi:hypothetical protein
MTTPTLHPPTPTAGPRSRGRRNASCAGTGLGNGGTPPPWRYQRRISTLGPLSKRPPIFRQDWLEIVNRYQQAGTISSAAAAVAEIVASRSNRHGADINSDTYRAVDDNGQPLPLLTEPGIGALATKRNGQRYAARWASNGLDELKAAGLLDWDHGTETQRNSPDRRRALGGRWQGPAIYRLLIPDVDQARLNERRTRHRAKQQSAGSGRAQRPRRHDPRTESRPRPPKNIEADQADRNGAALAWTAPSWQAGIDQLEDEYRGRPDLYEAAYASYTATWQLHRARGPTEA